MKLSFENSLGDRVFQRLFKQINEEIQEGLEEEMYEVVKKIEADAVLDAPVDTGKLRNSIYSKKIGHMWFEVGTKDSEYAVFVHEGTKHQRPQPFLTSSIYKNVDDLQNIAEKVRKERIK